MVHAAVLVGAYAILWFLILFCRLPVGLGGDVDPNSGAPAQPLLARKLVVTTVAATLAWAVFYLAIAEGWIAL